MGNWYGTATASQSVTISCILGQGWRVLRVAPQPLENLCTFQPPSVWFQEQEAMDFFSCLFQRISCHNKTSSFTLVASKRKRRKNSFNLAFYLPRFAVRFKILPATKCPVQEKRLLMNCKIWTEACSETRLTRRRSRWQTCKLHCKIYSKPIKGARSSLPRTRFTSLICLIYS